MTRLLSLLTLFSLMVAVTALLSTAVGVKAEPVTIPGFPDGDAIFDTYSSLTTYEELVAGLLHIEAIARYGNLQAGPLVKRGDNDGLLEIPENIIDDVINTIPEPLREEYLKEDFGKSTQRREIMAARVGNPDGIRVMVVTQQHGNESASTEAMLKLLEKIGRSKHPDMLKIRNNIDLLVVVRANPDGGEPNPYRCLMADQLTLDSLLGIPSPIATGTYDCAMHRNTVDPSAGFGTLINGRLLGNWMYGFNPNRYHFTRYQFPIFPREVQALVAAAVHFAPRAGFDLHQTNIKLQCPEEGTGPGEPSVIGELFTLLTGEDFRNRTCTDRTGKKAVNAMIATAPALDENQTEPSEASTFVAHNLSARLLEVLNEHHGKATRFAQRTSSLPPGFQAATEGWAATGAVGILVEVMGFGELNLTAEIDITQNQTAPGYPLFITGEPGRPVTNWQHGQMINMHRTAVVTGLLAIADGLLDETFTDDGGYSRDAWKPPNLDHWVLSDQLRQESFKLFPPEYHDAILNDPLREILLIIE